MKLFDLCSDILIDVFTVWLPLEKSLCAFDSSLTNTTLRVQYLSLIHLNHCIFGVHCEHPGWLKWILLRDMHISSVMAGFNGDYCDTAIEVMKQQQKFIRHLEVSAMTPVIDLQFTDLCDGLINLTSLNIYCCSYSLLKILDVIPNPELLKKLSLSNFSATSLSVASHRCINLEKLTLYSEPKAEFNFDGCFSKLRDLTLDCSSEITNKVIEGCQTIKKLDIAIYNDNYSSLLCLKSLEQLRYGAFYHNVVNVSNIVDIVSNNNKLTALTLELDSNPNDVVSAITQHCISFEQLKVNGSFMISNDVLVNFVNKFSSLKSLSLSKTNVNKQFVEALSRNCLSLEELSLLDDITFTDDYVMMVTRGCVNLRTLKLNFSELLTDKSILHISTNCNQLVTLYINASKMSMEVFKTLAYACPLLELVYMFDGGRNQPPECLNQMREDLVFLKPHYVVL